MGAADLRDRTESFEQEIMSVFGKKAIEVISKQIDIEVTLKQTRMNQNQLPQSCEIESHILFESDEQKMSISLCFPEDTILNIVSCVFDEDRTEVDEEILETCGEFLNIIYGAAKTVLNDEMGYNTKIAIPKLTQSSENSKAMFHYQEFRSDAGPFFLEFKTNLGAQ